MIVYLSGKITGNNQYYTEFEEAEKLLTDQGHIVLNPAALPEGLPREKYIPICLAMIEAAEIVFMLKGWESSAGANLEKDYAKYQGKLICDEAGEAIL